MALSLKYIQPKGGCQTQKAGEAYFKPTDRGRYSPSWERAGIGNGTEDQQRRSAPASGDWLPDFHSQSRELDLTRPTTALRKSKLPPPDSD